MLLKIFRRNTVSITNFVNLKLVFRLDATTLCQGDTWTNNVMMSLAEDGSVMDEIIAIIDWQIIFEGFLIKITLLLNICRKSISRFSEIFNSLCWRGNSSRMRTECGGSTLWHFLRNVERNWIGSEIYARASKENNRVCGRVIWPK